MASFVDHGWWNQKLKLPMSSLRLKKRAKFFVDKLLIKAAESKAKLIIIIRCPKVLSVIKAHIFRKHNFDHWVWTFQNHFFRSLVFHWFNIISKHARVSKASEKFFSLDSFNRRNNWTDSFEKWRNNLIWRFDTCKNMHFSVSHKDKVVYDLRK